jgi:DNA-binding transcriptional ArsR family regulator
MAEPDLARLAQLLMEPARAAMLTRLLDGRSWTAGELARAADVKSPAASVHLKKLASGGVVTMSRSGRHRYFRLSGERIARLLEQLQFHAPPRAQTPGQLRASAALQHCRLCYDHLAGSVGVALTRAMMDRLLLVEEEPWFRLTEAGVAVMLRLDVQPAVGRTCMDWSERRFHLGGQLGAHLAQALLARRHLLRSGGSRALRVTADGWAALEQNFGIVIDGAASPPPGSCCHH